MANAFTRHLATTATLAALAASLALPALAQPQPAPDAQNHPHHRMGAHAGADGQDRQQQRQAYMAKRTAALKDQLKLTPAQEPAWTAFTTAMQPGERKARLERGDMEKLTTPERIDRMRALRAQHAAEADRRGEATKAFYAALTPEQQKTFDAQTHRGHRGMHSESGRPHHGAHGHHGGGMHGGPAPAQK